MRLPVSIVVLMLVAAAPADEPKGTVVKLDKLSAVTPAEWKSEKPNNRLRSYQFRLPGAKDSKDAEIYIFPDLTKTVEENFSRYKEMFQAPDGMTVDDIAKTAKIEVGAAKVSILDIEGTWIFKDRPFDPNAKTELRPNSRVIFVIFQSDDGCYLIRLGGPTPTVKLYAKGFYDWIKAFK